MNSTGAVEHAILAQVRTARAAYAAGDHDAARDLCAELINAYGLKQLAEVMQQRDTREQLGVEVELLRLFGPALYGRADPSS
ncbi:hypothetical protein [Nocardia brasiliensis]|uniref:hypothetical protein n=1 Tax=Nocardia brasiliensis TaxID=37326 RepID=UPI0024575DA1|nr:hypothetical protein [Nocardia brasiliensis]